MIPDSEFMVILYCCFVAHKKNQGIYGEEDCSFNLSQEAETERGILGS